MATIKGAGHPRSSKLCCNWECLRIGTWKHFPATHPRRLQIAVASAQVKHGQLSRSKFNASTETGESEYRERGNRIGGRDFDERTRASARRIWHGRLRFHPGRDPMVPRL